MTTTPLFCRVTQNANGVRALVPADKVSAEKLSKVKPGKMLMVETESARNPQQLRLYWSIMDLVAENSERFDDAKHVSNEVKMNTGHVERCRIKIPGSDVLAYYEWPASIRYASMKQSEFAPWFDRAVDYITTEIWPGMEPLTIREQLAEMLGVDDWPAPKEEEKV